MKGSWEVTTERKEEPDDEGTDGAGGHEREMEKQVIEVYGLGYLYYLDPDADHEFKERLTSFIAARKIDAGSALVMEEHVDDRVDEKEPALFFLKLDDRDGTIVKVSFEKTSGRYAFAVSDGKDIVTSGREDKGEGRTEFEIPESKKEERTVKNPVSITDLDGDLGRAADMEDLEAALEQFLTSIDEGRREAVLAFETVRHDGRNVEVVYDGSYHFRLI